MKDLLSVTVIQPDIHWEEKAENLKMFDKLIGGLNEPTDLIILPEMFTTGFTIKPAGVSEGMNGDTVKWMKSKAAQYNSVITGSIVIQDIKKFYNRLIWIEPDGSCSYYDKRHLFRMGEETTEYSAGNKKLITKYKGWRFRPLICYDLRFPVWSRNQNDYDMLIYVANWPQARRQVWKNLLIARALENQVYVAGVNRVGIDGRKIKYSGDSLIIDPKGNIISELKVFNESTQTVSLSISDLNTFRKKFPVYLDADDFQINN